MPTILEWTHTVIEHDLDELEHANNISYLKWMQSAALAHSAGWLSSYHAGGTQALMADGSVRFLSAQTDPALLKKLATVDGGEAVGDY